MSRLDCIKVILVAMFMVFLSKSQRERFIKEVIRETIDKLGVVI